ncbi:MAG: class F sortase [Streptosporangiaceae bacterium]|jgi:sortase (surface protein transpeptidase)
MLLGKRRAALLVLGAGLIVAGAGATGLALTRHPVAAHYAAASVLPAPTGSIAAAPQQQSAQVSLPVALTIPSIGVQTNLIHLGLTAKGTLQVPPTTAVAGWYTGSPRPGAVGSAIIAGHIDSYAGPGIFFRLSSLRPGDRVYVRRADGTLVVFRVTAVRQFPKDGFPTSAVYGPTPDPELRLITCGGTFDPQLGSYLSNTVVYAVETS